MKDIGHTGMTAVNGKAMPSKKLKAGGMGTSKSGNKSKVTGLRAGGMGHKSKGRGKNAVTGIKATNTMEKI